MNFGSFKKGTYKLFAFKSYIHIKYVITGLALNNPQELICHKTQLNESMN